MSQCNGAKFDKFLNWFLDIFNAIYVIMYYCIIMYCVCVCGNIYFNRLLSIKTAHCHVVLYCIVCIVRNLKSFF